MQTNALIQALACFGASFAYAYGKAFVKLRALTGTPCCACLAFWLNLALGVTQQPLQDALINAYFTYGLSVLLLKNVLGDDF